MGKTGSAVLAGLHLTFRRNLAASDKKPQILVTLAAGNGQYPWNWPHLALGFSVLAIKLQQIHTLMKIPKFLLLTMFTSFWAHLGDARAAAEGVVSFAEKFAYAKDRAAVLRDLVPGTEEYYFFHGLHYQLNGNGEALGKLLEDWGKRWPDSEGRKLIQRRWKLDSWAKDPAGVVEWLKQELGPDLSHAPRRPDEKRADLPSILEAATISEEVFRRISLEDPNNMHVGKNSTLESLVVDKVALSGVQQRILLGKITNPAIPGLVAMISKDLESRESKGFGEFDIHRRLTVEQLEELRTLRPNLAGNEGFVALVLAKLRPGADVDLELEPEERAAWLNRAWNYVKGLPPKFNSLRAHVLYQQLVHAELSGNRDDALFLEYIKLPRPVRTTLRDYREKARLFEFPVDLNADYTQATSFPRIGDDEALLRRYLMEILTKQDGVGVYAEYLEDWFLTELLAEAKLTQGAAEGAEKWSTMLGPERVKALRDRVDLEFTMDNKQLWSLEEEVALKLWVKNVKNLQVAVYEINTENYARRHEEPINTDVNLDGLVAGVQQSHTYTEAPLKRVLREFRFPELKGKRGVWVVDFIGNGRSSRALLRKGELGYTITPEVGGSLLTILDEARKPLAKAAVMLGSQRLTANEHGQVRLPLNDNSGGSQEGVILLDGSGFAQRAMVHRQQEGYKATLAVHLEQESLLAGRTAQLAVRGLLTAEPGLVMSVANLDSPKLVITATSLTGQNSVKTVDSVKFTDGEVTLVPFLVPDRLHHIQVSLTGKVKSKRTGEWLPVEAQWSKPVSAQEALNYTRDSYLAEIDGQRFLRVLGKNGEPAAHVPVTITLSHRKYDRTVDVTLGTNENGQINLGAMDGIRQLTVKTSGEPPRQFTLPSAQALLPEEMHLKAGDKLILPWMDIGVALREDRATLLELAADGETPIHSHYAKLSLVGGYLTSEALPPGDYHLAYGEEVRKEVRVRVVKGVEQGRFLHGKSRSLESRDYRGVQLGTVTTEKKEVAIQVLGANANTRVHVVATRFLPGGGTLGTLAAWDDLAPARITAGIPRSSYVSGRLLGEEYRYILERQGAEKWPSLQVAKPSLLLNPWAIQETSMSVQEAEEGEAFRKGVATKPAAAAAPAKKRDAARKQMLDDVDHPWASGGEAKTGKKANGDPFASQWPLGFDFLAEPCLTKYNLKPDAEGIVRIPLEEIAGRPYLRIIAADASGGVQQDLTLAETPAKRVDLRLAKSLDAKSGHLRQNAVSVLEDGKPFVLADGPRAEFVVQNSLESIFQALSAKFPNIAPQLENFRWLLHWPTLDDATKKQRYSENACHEVHFFLKAKDPAFFQEVVKPFLANKHARTFLDDYLLENDLQVYTDVWKYGRLNSFERALLAQRVPGVQEAVRRELAEKAALVPTRPEDAELEFEAVLMANGLAEPATLALGDMPASPENKPQEAADPFGAPPPPPAPMAAAPSPPAEAGSDAGLGYGGGAANGRKMLLSGKDKAANGNEEIAEDRMADLGAVLKEKSASVSRFGRADVLKQMEEPVPDQQALWRQADATKEWAENNYYQLRQEEQGAELIPPSAFWSDFAAWDGKTPFLSRHVSTAGRNFTEAALALAVTDLPFPSAAAEPKAELKDGALHLSATKPALLLHREIRQAPVDAAAGAKLLVSQNFYRVGERKITINGQEEDKFVQQEFLSGVPYGCEVVITNTSSKTQTVQLLTQIPQGAMGLAGTKVIQSHPVTVAPYRTLTLDYQFYFPQPGKFPAMPVQVGQAEKVLASAEPREFNVVERATLFDNASWEYISQQGTLEQVVQYLQQNNAHQLDLTMVAWRCQDKAGYEQLTSLLRARRLFSPALWAYSLKHGHEQGLREWLEHQDDFLAQCGEVLENPLVTVKPVERNWFEHLEYSPLINARAHVLGREQRILNQKFHEQYEQFVGVLSQQKSLSASQQLAAAQYLLTQDRIGEAQAMVDAAKAAGVPIAEKIQLDYLDACLALLHEKGDEARKIAAPHATHPVLRWREKFAAILSQLDEINGQKPKADENATATRDAQQNALAAKEPTVAMEIAKQSIKVTARNVPEVTVSYYPMELEFLFSTAPFVSSDSSRFSLIQPAKVETLVMPAGTDVTEFALPKEFQNGNVLIEVRGSGKVVSKSYYANELDVTVSENYGQLQVRHGGDLRPLSRTYVKVFAEINGQPRFYKDGYTDLRGKFDYASLSTDQISGTTRLAILIMSEKHGAVVREVKPPQR